VSGFPGVSDVARAAGIAAKLARIPLGVDGWPLETGYELFISPGVVRLGVRGGSATGQSRSSESDSEPVGARGNIAGWTRKSRARMVRVLASVDYNPLFQGEGFAAMVTLTYPGCDPCVLDADRSASVRHTCDARCPWVLVAPTSASTTNHMQALAKRFERSWGVPWRCIWKREFQRRGAPHFHLGMVPPMGFSRSRIKRFDGLNFQTWLSRAWSDILAHPDPAVRRSHEVAGTNVSYGFGVRAVDPKRFAVYFSKHAAPNASSKEYQHTVTELWRETGAGRFWGVSGLKTIEESVNLSSQQFIQARRVIRRWSRSQVAYGENGATIHPSVRSVVVLRTVLATGEAYSRRARRRISRCGTGRVQGGFVSVNAGPDFTIQLMRAVAIMSDR